MAFWEITCIFGTKMTSVSQQIKLRNMLVFWSLTETDTEIEYILLLTDENVRKNCNYNEVTFLLLLALFSVNTIEASKRYDNGSHLFASSDEGITFHAHLFQFEDLLHIENIT